MGVALLVSGGAALSRISHGVDVSLSPAQAQARDDCEARGGLVMMATLNVRAQGDEHRWPVTFGDVSLGDKPDRDELVAACVPRECATTSSGVCEAVRSRLLRRMAGRLAGAREDAGQNDDEASAADTAIELWLRGKVRPATVTAEDCKEYAALGARRPQVSARGGWRSLPRVVIVGTHGPLSVLALDHLSQVVEGQPDVALYGQCYLCRELPACVSHHRPGLADRGCEWFHGAPEAGDALAFQEEVFAAAREVVQQEQLATSTTTLLVCIGLVLCHFLLEEWVAVPHLQLFCMNPLQGTPEALAPALLRALLRRVAEGALVFSTNAVTGSLLEYHAGPSSRRVIAPGLALLPRTLHDFGVRAPWSPWSSKLLLAMNFLLLHDLNCAVLSESLQHSWPGELVRQPTRWDFSDDSGVFVALEHRAVVYVPEHPYKNLFNDFYAMGLPLFLPSLAHLARLWPRVRHADSDRTYDGWFERRIPRLRLRESNSSPPAPMDLDDDGAAKVLHWLRLADFYHFPGVQVFNSVAGLVAALSRTTDLEAAREAMQQHFVERRAVALEVFRDLVSRSDTEKPTP